ncbi:hypothetical protein [Leucothrix arctica]|uniref:Lipoprotein n=1 Tax=Leucothrix arctica TaxID=1481894 RepID=A0A317C8T7_9GAMM|nr:hypothetical protein [Leucothrix arctica]PWQ93803.1 hypothetical protein DKT75_19565 [Leucothrix arctica]
MKKIALVLTVLAVTSLTACSKYKNATYEDQKRQNFANTINSTSPTLRASIITEKMVEELSLTEVQKNKVAFINEDFSTRYNILAASNNPKINKRDEFIKLTREKDGELKKILNNSQITKWHTISELFWEEFRII